MSSARDWAIFMQRNLTQVHSLYTANGFLSLFSLYFYLRLCPFSCLFFCCFFYCIFGCCLLLLLFLLTAPRKFRRARKPLPRDGSTWWRLFSTRSVRPHPILVIIFLNWCWYFCLVKKGRTHRKKKTKKKKVKRNVWMGVYACALNGFFLKKKKNLFTIAFICSPLFLKGGERDDTKWWG